ncbi:MAG: hypothetical protein GY754_21620 [bacterium]|nr:hypothetical protein [bacterium]
MNFPIFEALMITCFGLAWPFSIWKSYKTGVNKGKSLIFLFIIDAGYLFGLVHKVFWSPDKVIILYIINFIMVTFDIMLYIRNQRRAETDQAV